MENIMIGVKGKFSYSKSEFETTQQKQKSSSLQVGPEFFLRKYKLLENRFGLFFNHGLYATYILQKSETIGQLKSKDKIWGGGYNFTPGAFYKFSERFIGEASIGGLYADYNYNNGANVWSVGATFLSYFNLGIQYVIPGKRS
jgi:hypothetical protein